MTLYLQNGNSFILHIESYYTVEEITKIAVRFLGIDRSLWSYFGLYDAITKSRHFDERLLNDCLMIGDVLSQWELITKSTQEPIRSCKLYLGLKFFPFNDDAIQSLLPFIYYSKVYDIYFHKSNFDRFEVIKIWALCLQTDLGNYEDKPGVVNRIRNYFHPFYLKYYNDDTFTTAVLDAYKDLSGSDRNDCMQKFIGIGSDEFIFPSHFFIARFRNSNNPAFKDLQENLLLSVSRLKITVCEEVSRENILDIKLDEIMNWGMNQDILCICYGDKYEMIKLYFQVYDPFIVAEMLFNYGNLSTTGELFDYLAKNDHLEKFVVNVKNRKSNIFAFK